MPGAKFFSENHNFENPDILIRKQVENCKGVKINDNCRIGANVTILDGVEIRYGSLIAAGLVVTKSIQENSIAEGISTKILKQRSMENKKC